MSAIAFFLADEAAATAVEYAVMLALILITAIGVISTFGQGTGGIWSNVGGELQQSLGP